jgi:hypothetical protein
MPKWGCLVWKLKRNNLANLKLIFIHDYFPGGVPPILPLDKLNIRLKRNMEGCFAIEVSMPLDRYNSFYPMKTFPVDNEQELICFVEINTSAKKMRPI